MRLELTGYRYAYRDVAIQSVGDEIVGPAEVRQYLGQEIADAVHYLAGPSARYITGQTLHVNGGVYLG